MRGGRPEPGPQDRVEALERALATGGARLDPDDAARAADAVRRGRERAEVGGPAGSSTVIALAGATGSGKSSLVNAFSGLAVSQVGARRPTTSAPVAVVWGEVPDRLLDWLEVPRRHRTQRESALDAHDEDPLHGLVLLDLPDHDSTEVANRLQVDRLVKLVDLLVFVVDPQKYADDALHNGYLRPLARHQDLLLVVLNQVDRLDEASARACEADLRRLLAADGLDRVHVVRTSARTGEGVGDLRDVVAGAVAAKSAALRRTEADVEVAGLALREGVAAREPDLGALDGAEVLVDVLATAAGVPTVLDAVHTQELRRGRRTTGWPPTRWLGPVLGGRPDALGRLHLAARRVRRGSGGAGLDGAGRDGGQPETAEALRRLARSSIAAPTPAQRAQVAQAARRVAGQAAEGLPRRWADAVRAAVGPATDDVTGSLADALDQALLTVPLPVRPPLWQRAVGALQALLALVLVVGLVWTLGWAGVQWLGLPVPGPVHVGEEPLDVPLPWVLLAASALAGIALALLARPGVRSVARRRRRRVQVALRAVVAEVARDRLLDVVRGVLADHRATRESLAVVTAPTSRPASRRRALASR